MALTKYRLGDLIDFYSENCNISNLTINDVSGVNIDKEFFEPSKQVGSDTSKYQIVPPNYFACNLMHVGRDKVLPIALNHTNKNKIVSPAYTIFKIKDNDVLLNNYFFMMLKSTEKDRKFWFHTDGSVRDGMSTDDFCNIILELPDKPIQEKYVNIYNGMLSNQQAYEHGLEDLKLVCISTIESYQGIYKAEKIGKYIEKVNEKNSDGKITLEQGININKKFITPQRSNSNLKGRNIVRKGQFAYCTQLNNANVAIAYRTGEDCVVSSVYDIFKIKNEEELVPSYLMLWLIREEFGRFVYWASVGSAYEFLDYENISNYKIPIPPKPIQEAIANIYKAYIMRKEINDKLKAQIKDICPILIRGSLQE